jgi:hypothetical protein
MKRILTLLLLCAFAQPTYAMESSLLGKDLSSASGNPKASSSASRDHKRKADQIGRGDASSASAEENASLCAFCQKSLDRSRGGYAELSCPKDHAVHSGCLKQLKALCKERKQEIKCPICFGLSEDSETLVKCVICLEPISTSGGYVYLASCSHRFHTACLKDVKEHAEKDFRIPKCPICRKSIAADDLDVSVEVANGHIVSMKRTCERKETIEQHQVIITLAVDALEFGITKPKITIDHGGIIKVADKMGQIMLLPGIPTNRMILVLDIDVDRRKNGPVEATV